MLPCADIEGSKISYSNRLFRVQIIDNCRNGVQSLEGRVKQVGFTFLVHSVCVWTKQAQVTVNWWLAQCVKMRLFVFKVRTTVTKIRFEFLIVD